MYQQSFLNAKSFALILIMGLTMATEMKAMNYSDDSDMLRILGKSLASGGGAATAGALIAGPAGAAAGWLLGGISGSIIASVQERQDYSNQKKREEAIRKIRQKQADAINGAEIYIAAQRHEWGKPVYDGKPVEIDKAPFSKTMKDKHDAMILFPEHVAALQIIIKKLESSEQATSLLDYLQQCAILSVLPGCNPDGFRNVTRKAFATYIHATIYAHRHPLEDRLSETVVNLERYTKWFCEGVTARENIQKELEISNRNVGTLAIAYTDTRAEKERALSNLQQLNQQKQRVEADLAREREQHQKALQELEATKQKEQEVINIMGEIEELEEKHKEVVAENAELKRRAASPARRIQQKDARIAELEALLQAAHQPPQPVIERPAAQELSIIHVAPRQAEQPLFQRIQSWFEEKLK